MAIRVADYLLPGLVGSEQPGNYCPAAPPTLDNHLWIELDIAVPVGFWAEARLG